MGPPLKSLPACWNDDVRMSALLAPFRPHALNPQAYTSKMAFWKQTIADYYTENCGAFSLQDLEAALSRNGKKPSCLKDVVENMTKEDALCTRTALPSKVSSASWLSWATRQVLRPAAWVAASLTKEAGQPQAAYLVHLKVLEEQALHFLRTVPDQLRIATLQELHVAGQTMSLSATELLLEWLCCKQLAIQSPDGRLFKLSDHSTSKVAPFTEAELTLPRLRKVLRGLEESETSLQDKIQEYKTLARTSVKQGNRAAALNNLRQAKILESRLAKAGNSLDSLQHLIDTITQAHSDAEIHDAYKTGLGALKKAMKTTGLEEDAVFDTMDDLKEILDMVSDIEEALSQPIGVSLSTDMADLEAELRELTVATDGGNGGSANSSIQEPERQDKKAEPIAVLAPALKTDEEATLELENRLKRLLKKNPEPALT